MSQLAPERSREPSPATRSQRQLVDGQLEESSRTEKAWSSLLQDASVVAPIQLKLLS